MSSPLPVPSKAALRALRGLALGTSCAIGLILEDRRRRISTLRTAINNHKKLRSARQYHRDGVSSGNAAAAAAAHHTPIATTASEAAAIATALPSAACLNPDDPKQQAWQEQDATWLPPSSRKQSRSRLGNQADSINGWRDGSQRSGGLFAGQAHETSEISGDRWESKNEPHSNAVDQTCGGHKQFPVPALLASHGSGTSPFRNFPGTSANSRGSEPSQDSSPTMEVAVVGNSIVINPDMSVPAMIDGLHNNDAALDQLMGRFAMKSGPKAMDAHFRAKWLELSPVLCQLCLEKHRWADAQRLLGVSIRGGPLEEATYFEYKPFAIIDSVLEVIDSAPKDIGLGAMGLALELFGATFKEKPWMHSDLVQDLAKELITRLVFLGQPQHIEKVYWRVLGMEGASLEFTAWVIKALFDYRDHKAVLKYFRLNFSKMNPDPECYAAVLELVVKSVEELRGLGVPPLLRAMATMQKRGREIKTSWLMRMLQAHWTRHEDMAKSQDIFNQISSLGILDAIPHPEYILKVMVELSVRAGETALAHHFVEETLKRSPNMASDVGMTGYLALSMANEGDWEGVAEAFQKMQPQRKTGQADFDLAFLNILKVFATPERSTAEMEAFIKFYTDTMNVSIHRYMVTLVANRYGEEQNLSGFIEWLQYTQQLGFVVDASFCNAVLHNCRTKWKFSFLKLRTLFRLLRDIAPACEDRVTWNIMRDAAIADGKYAGRIAHRKIMSLRLASNKLTHIDNTSTETEVFRVMAMELAAGSTVGALLIYKRAVRLGMSWCPRCFRIAVTATLQQGTKYVGRALMMIHNAHKAGHDVTQVVAMFLRLQIHQFRGSFDEVMHHVQSLMVQFESFGVTIDAAVLTQLAVMCTQFGQHTKAVTLCRLAMDRRGSVNPCWSRRSLRALLTAYSQTLSLEGMTWLVDSLATSPLATDKMAALLLKSTRRHMRRWQQTERVLKVAAVVEAGIDAMRARREVHFQAGSAVYNETLRIMRSAVEDMRMEEEEEQERKKGVAGVEQGRNGNDPGEESDGDDDDDDDDDGASLVSSGDIVELSAQDLVAMGPPLPPQVSVSAI